MVPPPVSGRSRPYGWGAGPVARSIRGRPPPARRRGRSGEGTRPMDPCEALPRPIRVLLVDDHDIVRVGLRTVLGQDPRLLVVGEAGTGREALRLAQEVAPDVVVCDLNLPDVGGL